MKNTLFLFGAALLASSVNANALNLSPGPNAESEFYPAANNCNMHDFYKTPVAHAYHGGYQVSEGFIMSCSLPVKPGKYAERIVFDHYANGMQSRSCKVGYVSATSGGTVSNNMILARDGNVDVWYYDNLGATTAYSGGNPHNTLLLTCQHYNFTGSSWIRYGVIRVDYTSL